MLVTCCLSHDGVYNERESRMPKVGNEEFPYTKAGIAAAKAEAKEYGKKMVMPKKASKKKAAAKKKAAPKKKGK